MQQRSSTDNRVVLAVAGSRKTQGLVERCSALPRDQRALVLTFTKANQAELISRLAEHAGDHPGIEVLGWFSFLLREFARPFLPCKFPGTRVQGFNFDGRPHLKATGKKRFLDAGGAVYSCELGRLAKELVNDSRGALVRRLACCYDNIFIDEVQDLSAHDWDIIDILLDTNISLYMVGDLRQAVLATNPRSAKHKQYRYSKAIAWFREREASRKLTIEENCVTWRCRPEIAEFSDSIFDSGWSFSATRSRNFTHTDHDGAFLVRSEHLYEYVARYQPACLRDSANSGKKYSLTYTTFGVAKGMAFPRVLIAPTAGIEAFLRSGVHLERRAAAKFYVAVTRASQSVAIVLDRPGACRLPYWTPPAA